MDEREIFDSASSMASELENCIGYLEELRSSNTHNVECNRSSGLNSN